MNASRVEVETRKSGGITLPFPVKKIKEICAEIKDLEKNIIRDKVIIQGIIQEQIFFIDLNGIVRHCHEDIPFSTFVEIPGAVPEMQAQVDVVVEHISAELNNDGRSLAQKIILEIFAKVVDDVQLKINLKPGGPLVLVEEVVGENIKQELVISEIPAENIKIDDILADVKIIDLEVIKDKVIIHGSIHNQVFYIDKKNVKRHFSTDVPLTTFVDVVGASPGDSVHVNAKVDILKSNYNQLTSNNNIQELICEIFVKVLRKKEINIDTTGGPLVKIPFIIGKKAKQDMIISDILLDNQAKKVTGVDATFRKLKTTLIDDKVIVQGVLHNQIFYVDTDNVERHQAEEIPFINFLDVSGATSDSQVQFDPIVEKVIFDLVDGNLLHQKIILKYFVKVTESGQVNVAPGNGPLIKVKEVIGEKTEQVLIEGIFHPTPLPPLTIDGEVIRFMQDKKQVVERVLNKKFCLPVRALRIKAIDPEIQNMQMDVIDNKVLVCGDLVKQIIFVDLNNVVKNTIEVIPFEFLIDEVDITPDVAIDDLEIEIKNLTFDLLEDKQRIEQTVIFKITLCISDAEQIFVVTKISGQGIETETVTARAEKVIVPHTPLGMKPVLEKFGPIKVKSSVTLNPTAVEILDILAEVRDFRAWAVDGGVRFHGTINKEVIYRIESGEETVKLEEVPFDILYENRAIKDNNAVREVTVKIVDIQPSLSEDGNFLEQLIFLDFEFKVTEIETITVVTEVSGTSIKNVKKETVCLDLVDDNQGLKAVEVVTDVEINEGA